MKNNSEPLTAMAATLMTNSPAEHTVDILLTKASEWIMRDPLYDVCFRLLALHTYDTRLIDGTLSALLAKRLIAAEVSPGGPYKTSNPDDMFKTNVAIAQLFRSLGMPLSKVESYLQKNGNETAENPTPERDNAAAPTPSITALAVKSDLLLFSPELRKPALEIWDTILRADKAHEISQLSSLFAQSLTYSVNPLNPSLLDKANYYIWMAYSTYDDFLDEEGEPRYLPVANVMHRMALTSFHLPTRGIKDKSLIRSYFDAMDAANAWEINHCRFEIHNDTIHVTQLPAYRSGNVLYRRAGAHALGPLLTISGISGITEKQKRLVTNGLTHYIIARQLNDDIHDWKDDLAHGQISYVVTFLLRKTNTKPGAYPVHMLTQKMRDYFWRKGFFELNDSIMSHVIKAREAFTLSGIVNMHSSFIDATLQPIERSVNESLRTVQNQKDFLAAYTKK